jgi:hypothetical protein
MEQEKPYRIQRLPYAELGVEPSKGAFLPKRTALPDDLRQRLETYANRIGTVKTYDDLVVALAEGVALSQKIFGACVGYFYRDWNRLAHSISAATDGVLTPADAATILAFLSPQTNAVVNEAGAVNLALDFISETRRRGTGGAVNVVIGIMGTTAEEAYRVLDAVSTKRTQIQGLLQAEMSDQDFEDAVLKLFPVGKRTLADMDREALKSALVDYAVLKEGESLREALQRRSGADTLLEVISNEPNFFLDEDRRKVLQFLRNILNPEEPYPITADTQMFEFFGLFEGLKKEEKVILNDLLFDKRFYPAVLEDMTNILTAVGDLVEQQTGVRLTNSEIQAYLWQLIRYIREEGHQGKSGVMPMQRLFPRTVEAFEKYLKNTEGKTSKTREVVQAFLRQYSRNQAIEPREVVVVNDELTETLRQVVQGHRERIQPEFLQEPKRLFEEELKQRQQELLQMERLSAQEGRVSQPMWEKFLNMGIPHLYKGKDGKVRTILVPVKTILNITEETSPSVKQFHTMEKQLREYIHRMKEAPIKPPTSVEEYLQTQGVEVGSLLQADLPKRVGEVATTLSHTLTPFGEVFRRQESVYQKYR